MPFVLFAWRLIPIATFLVPFAYRFLWPRLAPRPVPFFTVTLTLAVIVGIVAVFGVADLYLSIGISAPSPKTAAMSARLESMLRIRLVTVIALAVAVQYLLCHLTQMFLRR